MKTTNKFFRFIGLPRCGNHALIFWLIHQYPKMVYDGEDQYSISSSSRFFRPELKLSNSAWMKPCPKKDGVVILFNNRDIHTFCNVDVDGQLHINQELKEIESLIKMANTKPVGQIVILSHESYPLNELSKSNFTNLSSAKSFLGRIKSTRDIIVMRDAYNAIASRLVMNRKMNRDDSLIFDYASLYKEYAKEFLRKTNQLKSSHSLNFNKWVRSVSYRRKIVKDLGLSFTDEGKDRVSQIGGGSSWDKMEYDSRASKMDLDNRWKHLKDDPTFEKVFKDDELVALSNKIYKIKAS